jgi:hypothetical protein
MLDTSNYVLCLLMFSHLYLLLVVVIALLAIRNRVGRQPLARSGSLRNTWTRNIFLKLCMLGKRLAMQSASYRNDMKMGKKRAVSRQGERKRYLYSNINSKASVQVRI